MILAALALAAANPVAARIDSLAAASGFAGEILIARGDTVLVERGYGPVAPGGRVRHRAGQTWRLASITKQATAAAVMRSVARGDLALDRPFDGTGGPAALKGLTVRMLLTHHTGLANPDATAAGPGQMPAFYRAAKPDVAYCLSTPAKPAAAFAYNNCDYLVLGDLLEAGEGAEGEGDTALWPGHFAGPRERGVPGFVAGKPEPAFTVATFGTAGSLVGTARDVLRFDRALMTDALMPRSARDTMWTPEGNGSYQALGQWVFPGTLTGCAAPKRIVQRDGEIQGVQTRNFIFPDDDLVVIVLTNRSADDFALGEVWQGNGFVYDLLSAAACA